MVGWLKGPRRPEQNRVRFPLSNKSEIRKKISLLVHDLSKNGIVRVYPIAKVLERHFEVELVGFCFEGRVFPIYRKEFRFTVFKCDPHFVPFLKWIPTVLKALDGDVIYAFKPRVSSYGVGLIAKLFKGKTVVLDNEDWEGEHFYTARSWAERKRLLNKDRWSVDNPFYRGLMEKLIPLADAVTVVSSFLQKRSGGNRLVHGADCTFFDSARYDRSVLREQWGVTGKFVVLFAGTVFPHKGLEEIIDAFQILDDERLVLMVAGVDNVHVRALKAYAKHRVCFVGPHPHDRMPEFLALSDTVILPLKDTPHAHAQVPGKVFEAMAMAKPIIASNVSDLREILDGCGIVIRDDSASEIANGLSRILKDPVFARRLGRKAREKCIRCYSWNCMERTLVSLMNCLTRGMTG